MTNPNDPIDPNDTPANIRLAINIMASFAVGDDAELSWAKVGEVLGQEHGQFRLLQGFIALTGMLLQKMADFTVQHPNLGT